MRLLLDELRLDDATPVTDETTTPQDPSSVRWFAPDDVCMFGHRSRSPDLRPRKGEET